MKFVEDTVIAQVKSGAILLLRKVGMVNPPHIVLPLTVEPTMSKPFRDAPFFTP